MPRILRDNDRLTTGLQSGQCAPCHASACAPGHRGCHGEAMREARGGGRLDLSATASSNVVPGLPGLPER